MDQTATTVMQTTKHATATVSERDRRRDYYRDNYDDRYRRSDDDDDDDGGRRRDDGRRAEDDDHRSRRGEENGPHEIDVTATGSTGDPALGARARVRTCPVL